MTVIYREIMNSKAPSDMKDAIFASGIPRILDHFKNNTMALVSGFRAGKPIEENLERHWQLAQKVRSMQLGYVPVKGFWEGIEERSLLIPSITQEQAQFLSKSFDQDSYFWSKDGAFWIFNTNTGEVEFSGAKFNLVGFGRDAEFENYSETKRKKKFVFQSKK